MVYSIFYNYLILPERSPDAKCTPSGLIRMDRTPFLPSYDDESLLSTKFNSVFLMKFSSESI